MDDDIGVSTVSDYLNLRAETLNLVKSSGAAETRFKWQYTYFYTKLPKYIKFIHMVLLNPFTTTL